LRFDKVALRFGNRLRDALCDDVAAGMTLIVTITAPLRQSSKTANELIDAIRPFCARSAKGDLREKLYDNSIAVRLAPGIDGKSNVIVLVHNPHPDASKLLAAAEWLLDRAR
jgi:hypothetical protein